MTEAQSAPVPAAGTAASATRRWLVLVTVALAVVVSELDVTVVSIAMPSMQRGLDISAANLQWVLNGYLLCCGGFLLLAGRVADTVGRKRLFVAGMLTFAGGSALNAAASSVGMLAAGRALQGLAAAMLLPTALSTVTTTFTDVQERTRALGVWTAMQVASVALGLILGGVITDVLSWRWIFLINIPIAGLAVAGAVQLLPAARSATGERTFDTAGALTVTAGLALLVYAVTSAPAGGWESARFLGSLLATVILFAGFVIIERRSRHPLVRLSIFRLRAIRVGNIGYLLVSAGMYGVFYFASLYVQDVLGYSPLRSGAALLPLTLGVIGGSALAQPLIQRLGVRPIALGGTILCACGMVLLVRTTVDSPYTSTLLPGLLVLAVGLGLAMVPFTMLATTGVTGADAGLASGLYTTNGYLGGAVGLALLSSIAANRTAGIRSRATAHGTGLAALVGGYHAAYLAAALLLALAVPLLASLRSGDVPLARDTRNIRES